MHDNNEVNNTAEYNLLRAILNPLKHVKVKNIIIALSYIDV